MTATATKVQIRAAADPLYDQSEFDLWFVSPQALLQGLSPAQMVEAGRGAEVLRLIRNIEEGAYL